MKIKILDFNKVFQNLCFGKNIKDLCRKAKKLRDFDGSNSIYEFLLAHSFFIAFVCICFCMKITKSSSCEELIQMDGLVCIYHKNK